MQRPALPWLALLLLCVALSALPRTARAQDEDATVAIARERFKEGVGYFDKGQFDKARVAFLQAYALKKHPAVLLNLAQSEVRSGHEADAAGHFAQFLREHTQATEPERQTAERGLATARKSVAELTIEVDVSGADVTVDRTPHGMSPLPGPIYLMPGTYTVVASKDGTADTVQVTVIAGQTSTTKLKISAAAATTPPAAAPPVAAPAEPTPAQPSEPEPAPEPEPSGERRGFFSWLGSPVGVIGTSLTVIGLGTGIGFAIGSRAAYDRAESVNGNIITAANADNVSTQGICRDPMSQLMAPGATPQGASIGARAAEYDAACKKYVDNVDQGDQLKNYATIGFVVAGVAAVGTIVVYVASSPTEDAAAEGRARKRGWTARLVPWLSPTERGVGLVGEF